MLPRNIDLTESRDFSTINLDRSTHSILNELSLKVQMENQMRIHMSLDSGDREVLKIKRLYPWQVHEISSLDYFDWTPRFKDSISNDLGFEVSNVNDANPFVTGSYSERLMRKNHIESYYAGLKHCEHCGKLLDVFDSDSGIFGICRHCKSSSLYKKSFAENL